MSENIYKVIGIMSGSSLDGLDLAYVHLHEKNDDWTFDLKHCHLMNYDAQWENKIKMAPELQLSEFLKLNTAYGKLLGNMINTFINEFNLANQVDFIASHGHTIFHEPQNYTTFQMGDGASIAAITGLPVVSDLRNKDVALGGQGAPIVPIADRLLWPDYTFCLNIGGIANVTYNVESPNAFDVCTANQVLNYYASKVGMSFDKDGQLARMGQVNQSALEQLSNLEYYHLPPPKSLSNIYKQNIIAILDTISVQDALATMTIHIAQSLKQSLRPFKYDKNAKMLVTGGGAFNKYLISCIQNELEDIQVIVPSDNIIFYKEAIAMALIGALRWQNKPNVLSSVTGASKNSCAGAIWI